MNSWLVFRRDRVILNQWTKRNDWSIEWFSKTPFVWSLPIRQEILNVSQIGFKYHGICPPIFIQTWLQQYCRRTFFHSAYCSLSNPICFRSVWCRRTMIPGKIFTGFAKFQGIVSVNDFRIPLGLQELLQASLGFLWSFRFCTDMPGSIEWPSPAPRLRIGDCFEIRNCHWAPCDMLLSSHQNFQHEVQFHHCVFWGPCNFGPLKDLAISVSREVRKNTVFTQIRTSLRLSRRSMRRTCVWASAFSNSVIHKIFSELLQPFRYVGMAQVSPFLIVVFVFIWFGIFGWLSLQLLFWCSRRTQVSPFLPFNIFTWHSCGIGIYPTHVSSFLSSHTLAWHSWRCRGWWGRGAWGRRRMINFLPWRCHGCRKRQAWGRTRW